MPVTERQTRAIEVRPGEPVCYQDWVDAGEPVILKGYAREWPLVQAGKVSSEKAMEYLSGYSVRKPVTFYEGAPDMGGRFAYNEDITAFNFSSGRIPFEDFFERVKEQKGPDGDYLYVGSTTLDEYFPGIREENDLNLSDPALQNHPPLVSIWMGNRTIASAHYDLVNNIACCAVGRRRFTLFPPEQITNLYPGPLEPTPGGQVVSMVDFRNPDLDRYPRFARAIEAAQVAELEAGDVLVYPSMWWHNVEGLDNFNVLINYWWNTAPRHLDTPQNTLLHALLSLRDRPEFEKRAWRALFDYYIFGDPEVPRAHLPEHAQGPLAPMDEVVSRRLRAQLLKKLNR